MPGLRKIYLTTFAALSAALICGSAYAAGNAESLGGRGRIPQPVTPNAPCSGAVVLHGDGTYENAYAWSHGGQVAPDYGAFAERFEGSASICNIVVDLTQIGNYAGQTVDVYIWNNLQNLGQDQPGSVITLIPGSSMGPVAFWPQMSRHLISLPEAQTVTGPFWVGIWGDWPAAANAWYVAADEDGITNSGTPMTNVAPGQPYPVGWNPTDTIWEQTNALGIGFRGDYLTSSVPVDGVQRTTFGRVKSLFQ